MEYRFAVGIANSVTSSEWKFWTQGDDAYLTMRSMGRIEKISFHRSGICRWAGIDAPADGSNRLRRRWVRGEVPDAGHGKGVLLMSIAFPTNHLSTHEGNKHPKLEWIPPAPPGQAQLVEIFLTKETFADVRSAFDHASIKKLLRLASLRSGLRIGLAHHAFECGPVQLSMPRQPSLPGQVFDDLHFPDESTGIEAGRPIRMLLTPEDTDPPMCWELGGYQSGGTA